jgi:hypothetical protein
MNPTDLQTFLSAILHTYTKQATGAFMQLYQFGEIKTSNLQTKIKYLIQMLSSSYCTGVEQGK